MKLKAILTYSPDENDIFKIIKNLTLFIKKYVNENIMFQDMIKKISLTLFLNILVAPAASEIFVLNKKFINIVIILTP